MPPYWKTFLENNQLIGRHFSVSAELDLSEVGADIEIVSENHSFLEQTEYFPGIAVAPLGFVPVGNCLIGTGDPYFINIKDGEGGPLYRVYHDEVNHEPVDLSAAVAIVLKDYRELLNYPET